MFGKHFSSMYTGSMIGAGAVVFAVWGYVIANAKPSKKFGGYVELNATLLAAIIGELVDQIERAIEFLCKPDPRSRTPEKEGRRLIKLGPYDYQVVNWEYYRAIKDEENRREQNRLAQATYRAKHIRKKGGGEEVILLKRGDPDVNQYDVGHCISKPDPVPEMPDAPT